MHQLRLPSLTKTSLSFCLSIIVLFCLQACAPDTSKRVHLQGKTMGTTYNVSYMPADMPPENAPDPTELQALIDKRLVEVNQVASTYIGDSELSLLNKHGESDVYPLSEDLRLLLQESIKLAQLTQGEQQLQNQ